MPISNTLLQSYRWQNALQSALLLSAMLILTGLLGWILWGVNGIMLLVGMAALLFLLMPRIPVRLLMRMYRAQQLTPANAPWLYQVLEEIARRGKLAAIPIIYYIPSPVMNAFATGHSGQATLALTDGLLRNLNEREVIGVLAHEISHIRHNDLQVMGLADMFTRTTSILSMAGQVLLLVNLPLILMGQLSISWPTILLLIFSPNLSALAQLGLSRAREYEADRGAVELTGDPRGLASALFKLEQFQGSGWEQILLPGRKVPDPSLLRTHPPTQKRIERLLAMEAEEQALASSVWQPRVLPLAGDALRHPRWRLTGLWY